MQPPSTRVALYWAPERADPLLAAGNRWLGRDPELSAPLHQPAIPGLKEATAAPRLYGFHATLRPPMRLATDWETFQAAIDTLAKSLAPFDLPPLAVTAMDGFLVLRESAPSPALHALADACVRHTNPHRLPPSDSERAKRRAAGLSAEEEALLQRWGYPWVMQRWRFHMTLSRRLTDAEMALLRPAAEDHFAQALATPRRVTEICVFTQIAQHDLLLAHRLPLTGQHLP
jgi:hypothetical protein